MHAYCTLNPALAAWGITDSFEVGKLHISPVVLCGAAKVKAAASQQQVSISMFPTATLPRRTGLRHTYKNTQQKQGCHYWHVPQLGYRAFCAKTGELEAGRSLWAAGAAVVKQKKQQKTKPPFVQTDSDLQEKRPNDSVTGREFEVEAWMAPTHINDRVVWQLANCGVELSLFWSHCPLFVGNWGRRPRLGPTQQDWRSFDTCSSLGRHTDSLQNAGVALQLTDWDPSPRVGIT